MKNINVPSRHSGGVNFALGLPSGKLPTFSVGRNPGNRIISRKAGRHFGVDRYADYFFLLDSGLRRNDGIIECVEE